MKKSVHFVSCLAMLSALSACAQEPPPPAEAPAEEIHETFAVVGSLAPLFEEVNGYVLASVEQASDELLAYRPTDEVRTFGQILGHVAMAQYWFCNGAMGGGPEPENYEELTTGADLTAALQAAFDHCAEAYAVNDTRALERVSLWGQNNTRLWVLSYNVAHTWEHYGNLVTYMRANGMVPPSSQQGM